MCEAPLGRAHGGIAQTLYNILEPIGWDNIICFSPEHELKQYRPDTNIQHIYESYTFDYIPQFRNRVYAFFEKYLFVLNTLLVYLFSLRSVKRKLKEFKPDIILSCPNGIRGVVVHNILAKSISTDFILYLMDDWLTHEHSFRFLNVHNLFNRMLNNADKFIFISNELKNLLFSRFSITEKPSIYLHNPVTINEFSRPDEKQISKETSIHIAYAGALWDMHWDAFVLIARAIDQLNKLSGKVFSLTYYGSMRFWEWRKDALAGLNVHYGGQIAYEAIHDQLSKHEALLVTASFSSKYRTHSLCSVQTKLTDYLKANRPIISIGPSFSANHRFVKENESGIVIDSDSTDTIMESLMAFANDVEAYIAYQQKGWFFLKEKYEQGIVSQQFVNFVLN